MALLYRVVFVNTADSETDLMAIKHRLSQRFRLTPTALDKLLRSREMILKNNLTGEKAATLKMAIDETGAYARIEAMPVDTTNQESVPSFMEKRRVERRTPSSRDRRVRIRNGAIQPDRRTKDRRN
ncbi:MAG: hypothetical protein H0W44_02815 [Gammaproteobacteria bacterium]|nr:hypothetical protein [Gammaproteobacteria bacterium]